MNRKVYKPGQLYVVKDVRTNEMISCRVCKSTTTIPCDTCVMNTNGLGWLQSKSVCHACRKLWPNMYLRKRVGTVVFKMLNCERKFGNECSFALGSIVSDYSYVITFKERTPICNIHVFDLVGIFTSSKTNSYDYEVSMTKIPRELKSFLEGGDFPASRTLMCAVCDKLNVCPIKLLCHQAALFDLQLNLKRIYIRNGEATRNSVYGLLTDYKAR